MAQILDPLPRDETKSTLCCYVNKTSQIQVARITNIPNWYFERVVFPGQHLVFEALPEAMLEIHSGMMASSILSDKIPCIRLRVVEEDNFDAETTPAKKQEKNDNKTRILIADKKILTESGSLPAVVNAC